MYHANINPKKAGMNILISDKVDDKENCQRQWMPIICVCVKQSCKIYEGKYGWNWMEK